MNDLRIIPITLPNPYFEGANNVYVVDAGAPALIDTGIDSPAALAAFTDALERHGYALHQIEAIFLTHKHIDHFGLAHRLQGLYGVRVYVHRADHEDVARFDERHEVVSQCYLDAMRRWGLPAEMIERMAQMRVALGGLGRSVPAEPLEDGERVPLGAAELRVIHTPGHTLGSACFQIGNALFTGDHVLPDYTPNVGATDVTSKGMLARYLDSLGKIRRYAPLTSYPGHGDQITDLEARIETILSHHRERTERILSRLKDGDPRTVYELALELFGSLRDHHVLLGAGEVQAHLELLEIQGRVVSLEDHCYRVV